MCSLLNHVIYYLLSTTIITFSSILQTVAWRTKYLGTCRTLLTFFIITSRQFLQCVLKYIMFRLEKASLHIFFPLLGATVHPHSIASVINLYFSFRHQLNHRSRTHPFWF